MYKLICKIHPVSWLCMSAALFKGLNGNPEKLSLRCLRAMGTAEFTVGWKTSLIIRKQGSPRDQEVINPTATFYRKSLART